MIACIIFVFGALLEYTVILLQLKLQKVGALKRHNGYSLGSKNGQRGASTSSGPGGAGVTIPGASDQCTDLMLPRNGNKAGPGRKKSSAQGE